MLPCIIKQYHYSPHNLNVNGAFTFKNVSYVYVMHFNNQEALQRECVQREME